jgi:hypothetical protein
MVGRLACSFQDQPTEVPVIAYEVSGSTCLHVGKKTNDVPIPRCVEIEDAGQRILTKSWPSRGSEERAHAGS